MNLINSTKLFITFFIVAVFFSQGCAVWRPLGESHRYDEISRTNRVELDRKDKIDLLTSTSILVYEVVSIGERINYNKKTYKVKTRASYSLVVFDVFFNTVFFPFSSIILYEDWSRNRTYYLGQWSIERSCPGRNCVQKNFLVRSDNVVKTKLIEKKRINKSDGSVDIEMNGIHIAKKQIKNDGTVSLNIGNYPIPMNKFSSLRINFKYKDAIVTSKISKEIYLNALKKRSKPCNLNLSFDFDDKESLKPNGAIDAAEEAYAKIKLVNSGKGVAFGVIIFGESDNDYIQLEKKTIIGDLQPGEEKIIKLALKGDLKVPNTKIKLKFFAEEERGFASNTEIKIINTFAMIPPNLEVVSHRILDGKVGLAKGNNNGIPENGETFEIELFIKNSGKGEAKQVSLQAINSNPMVNLIRNRSLIGDILPGRTVKGKLVYSLDRKYKNNFFDSTISLKEKYGITVLNKQINIPVKIQKPALAISAKNVNSERKIKNGETVLVDIIISNRANIDAKNVNLNLSVAEVGPVIRSSKILSLGDIKANSSINPVRVNIDIPRSFQEKGITLKMRADQNEFNSVEDFTVINVFPSKPYLSIRWQAQDGMINNKMQLGKAAYFNAIIQNHGLLIAENVKLELISSNSIIYPYFPDNIQEKNLHNIPANSFVEQNFWIQAKKYSNTKPGNYSVDICASQNDFPSESKTITFTTVDFVSFQELAAKQNTKFVPSINYYSPPMVRISYPSSDITVYQQFITLQGYADDDNQISGIEIRLNDELIKPKDQRAIAVYKESNILAKEEKRAIISQKLNLNTGKNKIEIFAWDNDNLESKETIFVNRSKVESEIWAAVIGINNYKDSNIPDLKFAISDTKAMYNFFVNDLKLHRDNIFELYNEQATRKQVEELLGVIIRNKAKPQDTVIIYYSGHGAPEYDPTSADNDNVSKYLLTFDADHKSLWATAIPMERMREIFYRLSAERIVFLADTCYSGASGGKTLSLNTRTSFNDTFLDRLAAGRGRVIITASGAGELALEDENLGGGHGVFTYYLLEGLKGLADIDNDGYINTSETYQYVYKKVTNYTKNRQHPVKKGEEERPIILGIKR